MGDCVLTTPALELVKRDRPDLEIGVVVEERFRDVYEDNPDVARILPPEMAAVRRFCPLLCLNLHGGTRSAWMTAGSGARYRAGFAHYRFPFLYHARIPRAQDILGEERVMHTAEHVASAMFWLGVPRTEIPRARLFAGSGPAPYPRPYAVIHANASQPGKRWPTERFAEIARWIEAEYGFKCIFAGGPGDDLSAFSGHERFTGKPLRETIRLIRHASLFVGNDSGPAHVAAACGLPVAVIFGSSDREVWRPWRTEACVLHSAKGIQDVKVDEVKQALLRMRVHA